MFVKHISLLFLKRVCIACTEFGQVTMQQKNVSKTVPLVTHFHFLRRRVREVILTQYKCIRTPGFSLFQPFKYSFDFPQVAAPRTNLRCPPVGLCPLAPPGVRICHYKEEALNHQAPLCISHLSRSSVPPL